MVMYSTIWGEVHVLEYSMHIVPNYALFPHALCKAHFLCNYRDNWEWSQLQKLTTLPYAIKNILYIAMQILNIDYIKTNNLL